MATSADDLLQQAQRELYVATQELPTHWYGRGAAATQALHAYTAAWPTLAQAYLHVLRPELSPGHESVSASTQSNKPNHLDVLRRHLQNIAAGDIEGVGDAEPEQHLMRVAELTTAAGDALAVVRGTQPGAGPAFGTIDRALATLDHAARLTAVYAETSTAGIKYSHVDARRWLWISGHAQAAAASPDPTARSSSTGSTPIISSDDSSLVAALDRWRGAANDALQPTDSPTARLPLIAATLATTHSAAAALGINDGPHQAFADSWGAAANAWQGGAIRLPGPDHLELRTHTRNLRSALDGLVHQHQSGNVPPTAGQDRHALAFFLEHQAPAIEAGYRDRTVQLVQSMRPIIAARALARATPGPTPPRLANAARAGKWIPLPPNSAQAQDLQKTTIAASRTLARPEEPLPQLSREEIAQARRDRQPGSVKKSRVNMQAVQDQIAALSAGDTAADRTQQTGSPTHSRSRSQEPRH